MFRAMMQELLNIEQFFQKKTSTKEKGKNCRETSVMPLLKRQGSKLSKIPSLSLAFYYVSIWFIIIYINLKFDLNRDLGSTQLRATSDN
jgi:hypothetical protein